MHLMGDSVTSHPTAAPNKGGHQVKRLYYRYLVKESHPTAATRTQQVINIKVGIISSDGRLSPNKAGDQT